MSASLLTWVTLGVQLALFTFLSVWTLVLRNWNRRMLRWSAALQLQRQEIQRDLAALETARRWLP